MKSFITILIIAVTLFSCAQKITPSVNQANAAKQPEDISATSAKKPGSPQVAEGKIIFTTKCARCHGVKQVGDWTVQQWIPIIDRMKTQAGLDETEKDNVTAYVNFYAKSGG